MSSPHTPYETLILDSVRAMTAYWDANQVCRWANASYLSWFGRSRDEMIGITLQQLLGDIYPKNLPHIEAALNGIPQEFERSIRLPNGTIRHSLAHYYPDVVDGAVRGFVAHVADVSPLKKVQQELADANAILARLLDSSVAEHALKDRTFAVVSHDLRGPIGNLSMLLGMVDTGDIALDELKSMLPELRRSADSTRALMDELFAWAQASAGGREASEVVLVSDVVRSVRAACESVARRKRIPIVTAIPPDLRISTTRASCEAIVRNLVANAIKFSPPGKRVRVSAEATGRSVSIVVEDSGVGIEPERLEDLWSPTAARSTPGTEGELGTGLGLIFVKRLADRLGAHVHATSRLGVGSRFCLTMPASNAPSERSQGTGA